ncbi:hypothetical protein COOONC_01498 [Cooperia oncophora]
MVDKLYKLDRCPYGTWTFPKCNEIVNAVTDASDETMMTFLSDTVRREDAIDDEKRPSDVLRLRMFSLLYLIECLISRGAVVKDQLLLDKAVWINFLTVLNRCYLDGRDVCVFCLSSICFLGSYSLRSWLIILGDILIPIALHPQTPDSLLL